MGNRHFFNYATDFRHRNNSIGNLEDFTLSDKEFNSFTTYLSDKEYEYETKTEKLINQFKETAEEEGRLNLISNELELLENKLNENKKSDLEINKKEIKQILSSEIVSRYFFQKGRIFIDLNSDPEIDSAINILSDPKRYNNFLAP